MIAQRLTAQLLAGEPARDPLAVAERLLAIQGQDPRGTRLAIRARTTGLCAADVDRALGERTLLITWLNRGTLHMVRSEDYHWLHALMAPSPPIDRSAAMVELARRYLIGHAPADERDLAKWAGLPLRDIRAGLRAIAPLMASRPDGLLALVKRPPVAKLPAPRLLGAFDPLLLDWRSREAILGPNKSLITSNGLFKPFALVRGRAVASWRMPRGEVALEPFARLTRSDAAALAADAEDVVRYLGGEPAR